MPECAVRDEVGDAQSVRASSCTQVGPQESGSGERGRTKPEHCSVERRYVVCGGAANCECKLDDALTFLENMFVWDMGAGKVLVG